AVQFTSAVPDAAHSSIAGTGPVTADGASTSTITITLKNASQAPIAGLTPAFSATDTGGVNVYSACSATNVSGISTCTLTSTRAEAKTLSLTSPLSLAGGTVVFSPGAPHHL